jgi:RNA polymerase sigma-70 factor, ECF subfamily
MNGHGSGRQPDRQLVIAARAGSRPALEMLVRRYQRPIYHLCRRYVRDHDAAADLGQRAFLRALFCLDELREAGLFKSWLFRIATNLARNQLRDDARFVRAMEPEGATPPRAQAALEAVEQGQQLQAAIARLPPRQKEVVELRIHRELSFGQIARALDITENAAKVTFHHAGRGLRRLLDEPGPLPRPRQNR